MPLSSLRTPLLLAAAVAALAQTSVPPKDVDGWSKIKWGMSLDQVHALYPEAVPSADPYWSHLTLPAIAAAEVPFQVAVNARKPSDQVTLVSLWCYFGIDGALPGIAPNVTPRDYDRIKAMLIEKYGRPKSGDRKSENGDSAQITLWTFPSTTIELTLVQSRGNPEAGSIHIDYRAADRASLDAL